MAKAYPKEFRDDVVAVSRKGQAPLSGHISWQPNPTDRRKVVVTPVCATLAAAGEHSRPVSEGIDELAATLTPAERATVAAFIDGLVTIYQRALNDRR